MLFQESKTVEWKEVVVEEFETVKKEFAFRKVEFGAQQMRTLKLIDQDSLYSNLGLFLSEQCVHTIKVAVFQGTDQTIFKDRRQGGTSKSAGSPRLFFQCQRAYPYLCGSV